MGNDRYYSLNLNIRGIGQSPTLAINELSKQLQAKGKHIYRMELGQSPFPVPSPVVEALKMHAHENNPQHQFPRGYRPVAIPPMHNPPLIDERDVLITALNQQKIEIMQQELSHRQEMERLRLMLGVGNNPQGKKEPVKRVIKAPEWIQPSWWELLLINLGFRKRAPFDHNEWLDRQFG